MFTSHTFNNIEKIYYNCVGNNKNNLNDINFNFSV